MKRPVKMRRGFRKILPFPFLQRTDVLMNSAVLRGRVTGLQVTLRLLNFLGKAMRPPRNCSLPWPFAAASVRWSTQSEFIRVNFAQKPRFANLMNRLSSEGTAMRDHLTKFAECPSQSVQMHNKPNWDKRKLVGCTNASVVNTLKVGAEAVH